MPRKNTVQALHVDPRPLVERPLHEPGGRTSKKMPTRSVTVNLAESPLSWLHGHGHLTDRQLLAGETLRGDYEVASIGPQVTMRWDEVAQSRQRRGPPTSPCRSERMLSAKARFDAAMEGLGPDLTDIAWRVICAGENVNMVERAMGWPTRSGKLVLRIALDRLAMFYRLPG